MRKPLLALLLSCVVTACGGGGSGSASSTSGPVQAAAAAAFQYGYPLTETMRVCDLASPVNVLRFAATLKTPADRNVVRPNNDTLYSSACAYLGAGWVSVTLPPADRYMSVQVLDAYTNTVAVRDADAAGTRFVLRLAGTSPPDLPAGAPVVDVPTPYAFLIVRTLVNGPADVQAADALQRQAVLTAHSASVPASAPAIDAATTAQDFFLKLEWRLAQNPPPATERSLVDSFAAAGLSPSSAPSTSGLSAGQLGAWEAAYAQGLQSITTSAGDLVTKRGTWTFPKSDVASFGTDYALRATIAYYGLFALPHSEALYPTTSVDSAGAALDGAFNYTLVLPATWPPVDPGGFWSLTMYDPSGFLVANPANRYSLGDRTPGLRRESDGTIRIYIRCADPGGTKSANWLPAPCTPFNLTMRLYLPTAAALDPAFTLPPVTRD